MIIDQTLKLIGELAANHHPAELSWLGLRHSKAVNLALEEGWLYFPRPWSGYRDFIIATFGLTDQHCFLSSPHSWARFHEPQITKGFSFFLSQGSLYCQKARASALLYALRISIDSNCPIKLVECIAEQRRIDLQLVVTDVHGTRIGVVVEAKFGHKVTEGQLEKYVVASKNDAERMLYYVIAPENIRSSKKFLAKNRVWEFTSWFSFLRRFDMYLHSDSDDDDFRRFRRTVWSLAYGF